MIVVDRVRICEAGFQLPLISKPRLTPLSPCYYGTNQYLTNSRYQMPFSLLGDKLLDAASEVCSSVPSLGACSLGLRVSLFLAEVSLVLGVSLNLKNF